MKRYIPAVLAFGLLAGCGGDGSKSFTVAQGAMAAPTSVNFTVFTKNLLAIHSDSAEPVAVSAAEFVFPDDDNPQAFADVLAGV